MAKKAHLINLLHEIIGIVSHCSSVENELVMMRKFRQELVKAGSDEKAWLVFVFRTHFERNIVIFIPLEPVAINIVY